MTTTATKTSISGLFPLQEGVVSKNCNLLGFLVVVKNDRKDFTRGTILLVDPSTGDCIPCQLDRFHIKLDRQAVIVTQWNYINDSINGFRFLEFSLDKVYMSDSQLPVLRSGILDDNNVINLAIENEVEFDFPSPLIETIDKEEVDTINIAGIVESVSVIYSPPTQSTENPSFFVELSDPQERYTVTIFFHKKELIKYHPCFRIGQYHTFQHLSPTKISHGRHIRGVLLFNLKSTAQIITPSIYHCLNFKSRPNSSNNSNEKYQLTISNIVNKKSTYTGYITRIIDSMLGIYELDDAIILCLYHSLSITADRPIRVNTKIHITHFHKALINVKDSKSFLLNDLWNAPRQDTHQPYVAMVACIKTRIEFIAFPYSCDAHLKKEKITMQSTQNALSMYMLNNHYTFSQLMRLLEIYATLIVRFKLGSLTKDQLTRAIQVISKHVFTSTNTRFSRGYGDLGNDFFQHDITCSAIGSSSRQLLLNDDEGCVVVDMDSYPYIDQCVNHLKSQMEAYQMDLAGGNYAFEVDTVKVKSAKFSGSSNDYYILGVIDMNKDGRLILKDNKSHILISTSTENIQLGSIYLLRRGHLFCEDLSYPIGLQKQDLTITYLSSYGDDLLQIYKPNSDIKFYTRQKKFFQQKLGFFSTQSNFRLLSSDHQYVVAHVINKFPIATSFTRKGFLTLESRLVVRLYNVGPINNPNFKRMDPLKVYILVLNSRNDSLKFYTQLQVDGWCVIYGLDQTETRINSKAENVFAMDGSHKLYPIEISSEPINDAVLLTPVMGNHEPVVNQLPHPVLSISELLDINRPRSNQGAQNFEAVNVRGVVILKKYDNYKNVGTLDDCAKQLHEDLGIGTGESQRKIQIQLREHHQLQMISIYMDFSKVHYPIGLVHGSTVILRNLVRKIGYYNKSIYSANSETLIQVETTTPDASIHQLEYENIEVQNLARLEEMYNSNAQLDDTLFKIHCSIASVLSLGFKWQCNGCLSIINNGECYAKCQQAHREFIAHAYIQVADGTTSANVNLDGERLVFRLLRLSDIQVNALKELVMRNEIKYNRWNSSSSSLIEEVKILGTSLEDFITRAKSYHGVWLYGKVQYTRRKKPRYDLQKGEKAEVIPRLRPVTVSDNGGILHTFEYTKLKIKLFEIEASDPVTYAYSILENLQ